MENIINPFAKFQTGQLATTQQVSGDIFNTEQFSEFCQKSLERHQLGDWGDLEEEDKESNEEALIHNDRLFSCYLVPEGIKANGSKIYIITEYDRSVTTILYPSEY